MKHSVVSKYKDLYRTSFVIGSLNLFTKIINAMWSKMKTNLCILIPCLMKKGKHYCKYNMYKDVSIFALEQI